MKNLLSLLLVSFSSVVLAGAPIKPSNDAFYDFASGYESANNGDILKWRRLGQPIGFLVFPEKVDSVYQLQFRTEDVLGNPLAGVNTVIIPYNADYTKFVTYLIAEDAPNNDCSPSYMLQLGSNLDGIGNQIEAVLITGILDLGYIVNVPDYQGPNSAFAIGQTEGRVALDSIRATLASTNITGVDCDAKNAIWGYSGGSMGTGWAASLHASYAPELSIAGAAMGGVVPNITAIAEFINGGPAAGFLVTAITTLLRQYNETLSPLLPEYFISSRQSEWDKCATQCEVTNLLTYLGQNVLTKYFSIGEGLLTLDVVQEATNQNLMGQAEFKPIVPIYMYHARLDEIAPFPPVQTLYNTWCSQGISSLYFEEDVISEHVTNAAVGSGDALAWIKDRLEGNGSPVKGCKKEIRINSLLNLSSLGALSSELLPYLLQILGRAPNSTL